MEAGGVVSRTATGKKTITAVRMIRFMAYATKCLVCERVDRIAVRPGLGAAFSD